MLFAYNFLDTSFRVVSCEKTLAASQKNRNENGRKVSQSPPARIPRSSSMLELLVKSFPRTLTPSSLYLALISSSIEGERKKKGALGAKRYALKFTHVASSDSRYVIRTELNILRADSASRIFPARYLSLDAFPCSEIPPCEATPRHSRSNGSFRSAFAEMQPRKS